MTQVTKTQISFQEGMGNKEWRKETWLGVVSRAVNQCHPNQFNKKEMNIKIYTNYSISHLQKNCLNSPKSSHISFTQVSQLLTFNHICFIILCLICMYILVFVYIYICTHTHFSQLSKLQSYTPLSLNVSMKFFSRFGHFT